ncbi:hypothetical protein N7510_008098 [Penicillium lagena]|uniref:uncharacterized protein n=1 Tax=Penicillium lagena TaxID=94218 RepID=UPI002540165E|nr:uncharacterized protein N7510_008098 [Penicillium lagena]KAJ5611379.1 hypothetical protein N7510_008098 [Penicillium lagena]
MFILKVQDSSYAGLLDVEGGKRAFNTAISLLRRASLEDNDLPGRTSKILAQLWAGQGSSKQTTEEPSLQLRTRLAASLLHDSLWTWRKRFGGQGTVPHTPSPLAPANETRISSADEDQFPFMTDEIALDGQDFGDVFDAEILSLLPFSVDGDPSWQPAV